MPFARSHRNDRPSPGDSRPRARRSALGSFPLPPDGLAEIDLVLIGERTSAGADGASDRRSFDRSAEQPAADRTSPGADSAATDGAIRCAATARAQCDEREDKLAAKAIRRLMFPQKGVANACADSRRPLPLLIVERATRSANLHQPCRRFRGGVHSSRDGAGSSPPSRSHAVLFSRSRLCGACPSARRPRSAPCLPPGRPCRRPAAWHRPPPCRRPPCGALGLLGGALDPILVHVSVFLFGLALQAYAPDDGAPLTWISAVKLAWKLPCRELFRATDLG